MLQRLLRPLTLGIGGLFGSAIAFWGLGKMLTGVWQQQTFAIESPLLLWIHEQANPILDGVMLMITKLGNSNNCWSYNDRHQLISCRRNQVLASGHQAIAPNGGRRNQVSRIDCGLRAEIG
ncbi:MAG: hypothetical protein GDA38_10960 [Hormoscilla sp. SP12CHS1]|nr:hypothetical protein [Hormoscilla sp. SP12CHS1]